MAPYIAAGLAGIGFVFASIVLNWVILKLSQTDEPKGGNMESKNNILKIGIISVFADLSLEFAAAAIVAIPKP